MGATSDHERPGRDETGTREPKHFASPGELPEDLIAVAQSYFADGFPNPQRVGCPPPGNWLALIRRGDLPNDQQSEHLFDCSECFRFYRKALTAHKESSAATMTSWRDRLAAAFTRPAFVLVTSAAVLLLLTGSLWLGRESGPATAETSLHTSSPSSATPPARTPAGLPLAVPDQTADRQSATVSETARLTVRIDLEAYVALRDASGQTNGKTITLRPARTRLQLRMPTGRLAGRYTISLTSESGRALIASRSFSRDGASMNATLNLQSVRPGKYLLRVARRGEAPDFYLVKLITATKSRTKQ